MLVDIYFFQSVGQQFNDGTRIILYIDLSPRQYVRAVTILCLLLDIAPQGICIRGGSRERAHPPRAPPKIGKNMIFPALFQNNSNYVRRKCSYKYHLQHYSVKHLKNIRPFTENVDINGIEQLLLGSDASYILFQTNLYQNHWKIKKKTVC
jgi:hypothetical protein